MNGIPSLTGHRIAFVQEIGRNLRENDDKKIHYSCKKH